MGYTEFITNYIRQKEVGQPIYSADIALALAKEYRLPETKAGAAVAVLPVYKPADTARRSKHMARGRQAIPPRAY